MSTTTTQTPAFAFPTHTTPPLPRDTSTAVVEAPKVKPQPLWKSHGVPVAGSVIAVSGAVAGVYWLPADFTLAGAAIASAAVAGVAAARVFTTRIPGLAAMAALAGAVAVAAITTLGATQAVNRAASASISAQQVFVQERAALSTERTTLTAERAAVAAERTALRTERGTVQSVRDELAARREALDTDKGAFQQRVTAAAATLAAPEREALATAKAAVEAERKTVVEQRFAPIAAEARRLTEKQLAAVTQAIDKYSEAQKNGMISRFVGEPFAPGPASSATERTIDSSRVIATLVSTGRIYAGPASISGDTYYVVEKANAQPITSVAQLLELLRLSTGTDIAAIH